VVLVAACSGAPARPAPPPAPRWTVGPVVEYQGICDASAALVLPGGVLAVADDETNLVALYRAGEGGAPLALLDATPVLGLADPEDEADLEGLALQGERVVLLASHGRKKAGKPAPDRLRLAAARLERGADGTFALVSDGHVYTGLVDVLVAAPALGGVDVAGAAARSPTQPGGLNIEGITETGAGTLTIGLRSPLAPDGRAVLVELGAPERMFAGTGAGAAPEVRRVVLLDLGGRGVRALATDRDGVLVAAGAWGGGALDPALYRWPGGDAPAERLPVALGDLNIEALAPAPDGTVIALSDDGERPVDGVACKKQGDPARKRFRGVTLAVAR
jgi:hypothetical protein